MATFKKNAVSIKVEPHTKAVRQTAAEPGQSPL